MTKSLPTVRGIVLIPPGTLSAWGDALIQRLAQEMAGAVQIVRVPFAEPLPKIGIEDQPQSILVSDYPSADLLDMIASRTIPTVCFADPPHSAVRHIMASLNIDLSDALRRYTAAATSFP